MSLTILVLVVIAGGASLILIARWARKKNADLGDQPSAWEANRDGVSFKYILFGSRSSIESGVGRVLAWLGIFVVLAFLVFAGYLVFSSM